LSPYTTLFRSDLTHGAGGGRHRILLAHDRGGALRIVRELVGLVRMYANGKPNVRPQRLAFHGLRRLFRVPRLEDDQRALEVCLPRAVDHLLEIARKRFIGEVAVTIDHIAMVAFASMRLCVTAAPFCCRRSSTWTDGRQRLPRNTELKRSIRRVEPGAQARPCPVVREGVVE